MSIINEALKKAEREKNKMVTDEPGYTNIASKIYRPNPEQNKNIETAGVEPNAVDSTKSNKLMWVLLAILSFVAIISISTIATNLKKETIKPLAPPFAPASEETKEIISSSGTKPELTAEPSPVSGFRPPLKIQPAEVAPSITEPPRVKIPASPPYLTLTGIVAGGNESFAIIDGAIVKKGDMISGAKVVEIYSDRVVLEFDGAEFSIRTP